MGGIGRLPMTPVRTLVPVLTSVLLSVPADMASDPMTLAADVVMTISTRAPLSVTPASTPMSIPPGLSSVGAPTSRVAALMLPRVETLLVTHPAVPDEADIIRPDFSSQGGVQPVSVLYALLFGVEADTYLPPIRAHGSHMAFATSRVEEPPKLLHDPDLGVYIPVLLCLHLPLCLDRSAASSNIRIPPPVLFHHRKLHPDRGGYHQLALFNTLLYLADLRQCSRLHVIRVHCVARVQEDLHLLVDLIHEIQVQKKGFPAKAF